jgi:2-polyprenyl-3-methyl-5-hydroxy-6-metoxy-1,4-benzoquinol methylase
MNQAGNSTNEFDAKAAEWDNNPMHWERSKAITEEMKRRFKLNNRLKALEFGAGTGIASFLLRDFVKEITLIDNSSEMVGVIKEKIKASKVTNLTVLNFDLEHNDMNGDVRYDLIFTQMVLHHVVDVEAIINKFGRMLNSGGHLAIADLYGEDGSFHGEGFTGHNGFDPAYLSEVLKKYKFRDITYNSCFIIDREISETETRKYPVFLLTANRY